MHAMALQKRNMKNRLKMKNKNTSSQYLGSRMCQQAFAWYLLLIGKKSYLNSCVSLHLAEVLSI